MAVFAYRPVRPLVLIYNSMSKSQRIILKIIKVLYLTFIHSHHALIKKGQSMIFETEPIIKIIKKHWKSSKVLFLNFTQSCRAQIKKDHPMIIQTIHFQFNFNSNITFISMLSFNTIVHICVETSKAINIMWYNILHVSVKWFNNKQQFNDNF